MGSFDFNGDQKIFTELCIRMSVIVKPGI